MLIEICNLILLFFTFSVVGWCIEVVLKYRQYGRFINRGFLVGPYLPIYGSGIAFITVLVNLIAGVESSIGMTFVISFVGCGTLEYMVSYYMEKRFHARWWDYSQKPMNLNGRVWIGNLVLFGLAGTVVIELINPVMYGLFAKIPETALYIISGAIVVVMGTDYTVSHFVMKFVKTSVESSEADSTESISAEIRMLMTNKSVLYKRFAEAYPEVVYRTDRINQRMQEIREEMDRLQQESIERWEARRQETIENWETRYQDGVDSWERMKQDAAYGLELMKSSQVDIQDEIIQLQENLIQCLRAGNTDQAELEKMQDEITEKKKFLEDRRALSLVRR